MNTLTLKILNKLRLLDKLNVTGRNGFVIPIHNKTGYNNLFPSEPWLIQLLKRLYTVKFGTFIDVGANIGQTLLKAKKIDPNIQYIGFEPNPVCNHYLQSLITANKFHNVQLFPVGLSNEDAMLQLYASSETDSGATMIRNFREGVQANFIYNIPVQTGDKILFALNLDKISILKIDVEGAELEVLQGLAEAIRRYQPFIVTEILPVYSLDNAQGQRRKERQDDIAAFLTTLHYKIFEINEKGGDLKQIETFEIHGDMERTNYIFCHESDLSKVLAPKDHRY